MQTSLAVRYRPKNMNDLTGQDHVRITLENAIKNKRLSHGYVFSGPRGTGKTSTARMIAKEVCCGEDLFCRTQADEGNLVDIIEIDAASNRGIDEMRDLREKIQFAPVMGQAKVYIIDEVHMLTKEAFNALLKTLEEPPAHAYFILATTEIHKIPETILSRCQHFSFQRISLEDVIQRLEYICKQEGIRANKEALSIIAGNARGGLRDAITTLEQMVVDGVVDSVYVKDHLGIVAENIVEAFTNELMKGDTKNALQALYKLSHEGYDLSQLAKSVLECLREIMLQKVNNGESTERVITVIESIQNAQIKLKEAVIPELPLEIACIELQKNVEGKKEEINSSSSSFLNVFGFGGGEEKQNIPKPEIVKSAADILDESHKTETANPLMSSPSLTKENIEQEWGKIVDQIKNNTIKVAIKSATIEKLEHDTLYIKLATDFYVSTLQNSINIAEIIASIESIFHQKVKIDVSKADSISLTPHAEKSAMQKAETPSVNVNDYAKEIFG